MAAPLVLDRRRGRFNSLLTSEAEGVCVLFQHLTCLTVKWPGFGGACAMLVRNTAHLLISASADHDLCTVESYGCHIIYTMIFSALQLSDNTLGHIQCVNWWAENPSAFGLVACSTCKAGAVIGRFVPV